MDTYVCPLGHRINGMALHLAPKVTIPDPPDDRSPGAFLRVLERELNQLKNDHKRDLARTIYGEETRMEGYRTSAAELLELVNAGLLTKEEGRIIALEMFPQIKRAIAEQAYAEAAKLLPQPAPVAA